MEMKIQPKRDQKVDEPHHLPPLEEVEVDLDLDVKG